MPAPGQRPITHRSERLGDQIRSVLAELLLRESQDPGLKQVTLTNVRMSRDLRIASVSFSTWWGGEQERTEAGLALSRASSFLRRRLGEKLRLRHLPELRFYQDHTLDRALRVEAVLADIAAEQPEQPPASDADASTGAEEEE